MATTEAATVFALKMDQWFWVCTSFWTGNWEELIDKLDWVPWCNEIDGVVIQRTGVGAAVCHYGGLWFWARTGEVARVSCWQRWSGVWDCCWWWGEMGLGLTFWYKYNCCLRWDLLGVCHWVSIEGGLRAECWQRLIALGWAWGADLLTLGLR